MEPNYVANTYAWQERPSASYTEAYESWTSTGTSAGKSYLTATGWMTEAQTQTTSLNDLVQQVLTSMLKDYLQSRGLPLIQCPHTKGLQLENIIKGIASSHQAMCTRPHPSHRGQSYDSEVEQASMMIRELSEALTRSLQQDIKPVQNYASGGNPERKRHTEDSHACAAPQRKKMKKAPPGTVYPCAKCGTTFGMQKDLIAHYKAIHSLTRPFKCSHCDKWFKKNSDCHKHTIRIHLNQYNYHCSICNKGAHTQKSLKVHEARHLKEEDRPFKCQTCNKGFVIETELVIHARRHDDEKKLQCELCTARFATHGGEAYKSHMDKVHKVFVRFEVNKCKLCDKDFGNIKQRPRLMEHMKTNHGDVGATCKTCGRMYATETKLHAHVLQEHEATFSCVQCDKKFNTAGQSIKHMKNDHPPLIDCQFCAQPFPEPDLEKHMREDHESLITCKICNVKFTSAYKLRKHYKKKHVSEEAYEPEMISVRVGKVQRLFLMCKLCGGMFTEPSSLDQHNPVHFNNEDALLEAEIADIIDTQTITAESTDFDEETDTQVTESKEENPVKELLVSSSTKKADRDKKGLTRSKKADRTKKVSGNKDTKALGPKDANRDSSTQQSKVNKSVILKFEEGEEQVEKSHKGRKTGITSTQTETRKNVVKDGEISNTQTGTSENTDHGNLKGAAKQTSAIKKQKPGLTTLQQNPPSGSVVRKEDAGNKETTDPSKLKGAAEQTSSAIEKQRRKAQFSEQKVEVKSCNLAGTLRMYAKKPSELADWIRTGKVQLSVKQGKSSGASQPAVHKVVIVGPEGTTPSTVLFDSNTGTTKSSIKNSADSDAGNTKPSFKKPVDADAEKTKPSHKNPIPVALHRGASEIEVNDSSKQSIRDSSSPSSDLCTNQPKETSKDKASSTRDALMTVMKQMSTRVVQVDVDNALSPSTSLLKVSEIPKSHDSDTTLNEPSAAASSLPTPAASGVMKEFGHYAVVEDQPVKAYIQNVSEQPTMSEGVREQQKPESDKNAEEVNASTTETSKPQKSEKDTEVEEVNASTLESSKLQKSETGTNGKELNASTSETSDTDAVPSSVSKIMVTSMEPASDTASSKKQTSKPQESDSDTNVEELNAPASTSETSDADAVPMSKITTEPTSTTSTDGKTTEKVEASAPTGHTAPISSSPRRPEITVPHTFQKEPP